MKGILFIILRSPHEFSNMELIGNIGGQAKKGVLLLEDAVYFAADHRQLKHLLQHVNDVYVMKDDLEARGFTCAGMGRIHIVDYPMAVDLIMEEYDQSITI
jgi:sulfur relay protein TusB/DsrH